jgi:hypothetical protein
MATEKLYLARYTFDCPLCKRLNTGEVTIHAENEPQARERFGRTLLKCENCPAHISGNTAMFTHISQKA